MENRTRIALAILLIGLLFAAMLLLSQSNALPTSGTIQPTAYPAPTAHVVTLAASPIPSHQTPEAAVTPTNAYATAPAAFPCTLSVALEDGYIVWSVDCRNNPQTGAYALFVDGEQVSYSSGSIILVTGERLYELENGEHQICLVVALDGRAEQEASCISVGE